MLTTAQPATLQFSDCFSSSNTSQKLDVSTVYAQFFPESSKGAYINFTVIGTSPQEIIAASNGTNPVATTLFTTTELLTFQQPNPQGNAFFCASLRPASPLSTPDPNNGYCPLSPGPFAFSSFAQVQQGYELETFDTRLRALDPYQNELLCLDLNTTILVPRTSGPLSVYGHANIVFWSTVGLAIGYWVVVGIARLVAAWGRGSAGGSGVLAKVEGVGFILASALSGERFASSPALMRFCTPSLRDIVFHTQWCAALSMVAVQWPTFTYPLLSQTAWATLSYNISLVQGKDAIQHRWNPLTVQPYNPSSDFADQFSDPSSPIFINDSAPNFLFQLPPNATTGISAFAWSVGLRPQDLFGTCLSLFLAILAATIVLSLLVWVVDIFFSLIAGAVNGGPPNSATLAGSRSPRYSSASKDMLDGIGMSATDENRSLNGHFLFSRSPSRFPGGRAWWKWRSNFVSLHGSALHGNLVRVLVLFHLPITVFSCYHMSLPKTQASVGSTVLAALSSVFFPSSYQPSWHGSQLFACTLFAINIAFGVTIGFGQQSGTAQAIIILVVEVAAALGTSIWLPWGHGASMGLISFLFCVGRIVVAVLLVILTPVVSIGAGAAQWVAYAILFILGLIYLAFLLMLIVKLLEAALRIIGGIGFSRSKHVVDSGLLGTMGLMGCCGPRHPHRNRGYHPTENRAPSNLALPRPTALYKGATPPSSGPPSVLRPEHAMQPYKEDSDDDETGFIMAAWQPFPGPGHDQMEERRVANPEPPKSGFARVAGGRAHMDSPYAIASGSTQTFPSVERERRQGPSSLAKSSQSVAEDSPPHTPSIASAARSLPPGAMPPAHVRTKSQTAIIENVPPLMVAHAATAPAGSGAPPEPHFADDVAALATPKKKHWYGYNRRKEIAG
uniref:Regulator Ustilago maydis 1 protein n=1 Tax=Ganoderma boninense TaxID=34458 RepID=A0A5K1JVQ5_9APHY|nr:Regulator Ustilago maydis 1 protein [Ganoderma boninense]